MSAPAIDLSTARDRAAQLEARALRERLRPPPKLSVSEWADRYRVLSREASAEPGRWRTDRAPYQRGILDACSDPLLERVVVMSSAQVGKTEILNNLVGFYVDQDPAPILIVQPTVEMAKAWSTDRLATMLRDSPRLKGKVKDPRARDSGNTMLHKSFPGGHITIVGANSASGLASRPIRVVLCDEVDRYPASAGSEGDPVTLATKRTATFWNRKLVLTSTPSIKGFSRIEAAFEESDRRHYHVPCPDCGALQTLKWAGVRWENSNPETACYVCEHCGVVIPEERKGGMLEHGVWIAENPGSRTAGFHLNAIYSPWARWPELVREFLESKANPERLKAFVNTVLGETWEDPGARIEAGGLYERLGVGFEDGGAVPAGVGLLTAGVDVQGDRLECYVWGWGEREAAWLISYDLIPGDPGTEAPWRELDQVLARKYADLSIAATCIDSGGHHTKEAYEFARERVARRIYPAKGMPGEGVQLVRRSYQKSSRVNLVLVGTFTAKDALFSRLKIQEPGPGYIALPEWVDREQLEQLTAEKLVTRYSKGRPVRKWFATRPRNEALDCYVLALAALHSLGLPVVRALRQYAAKRQPAPSVHESAPQPQIDAPAGMLRQPPRRNFVNRWR